MIFILISVIVPLVIALGLPRALRSFGYDEQAHPPWLCAACLLFFIAYYLPSPLIEGRDTQFVTHVVGGGFFTGMVWIYFTRSIGWKPHIVIEAASLFMLVSALGCLNELAELAIRTFGLADMPLDDTNWDILANTLGSAVLFGAYELYRRYR